MKACAIVGSVCPTFSVPGISFTGTRLRSLYTVVVVANEPMPSVSRNAVTKPMAAWKTVGFSSPPRTMVARYRMRTAPRPPSSSVLASTHELVGERLRDVDRRAAHGIHRSREQHPHFLGAVGRHRAVGREHRHRALQRLFVQRIVLSSK